LMVTCMLLAGCQEGEMNNPTAPDQPASVKQNSLINQLSLKQSMFGLQNGLDNTLTNSSTVTVSQQINGDTGGLIEINKVILKGLSSTTISASIKFPAGCFSGTKDISATVNIDSSSISFSPSMVFNIPVNLNLSFVGLNLLNLGFTSGSKVNFVYISNDNKIQLVQNSGILFNLLNGELSVKDAVLNHFSRYAFIY
jgi:hypothetical protein